MIANEYLEFQKKNKFELPSEMILLQFRPAIELMHGRKYREFVFTGGRGSTKSSFCGLAVMDVIMRDKNAHALILRKIKDTLKDSVFAQMLWCIDKLGLTEEFKVSTSPVQITRKATGQIIYFRGCDKPQSIKSIKPPFGFIKVLWFEELDQFAGDAEIRSVTQSAIRGGSGAVILKSFNPPKTNMNWANRYVKSHKSGMKVIHSTYLDVPPEWLGEDFIEEAEELKRINPEAYEHEYLGIANGTGGAVFENVTIRKITDDEIKIFDRIYRGIDWGWYPDYNRYHDMHYSAKNRTLYIYGEVSCRKTTNKDFYNMLRAYGVKDLDEITADSSEKKSVADLKKYGFKKIKGAIKGPGSVEAGMKWLQGLKEIVIDNERCPYAAKEFTEYEYEKDRNGEVVSGYPDKDNHSIDAVRYAMERVWRKRGM